MTVLCHTDQLEAGQAKGFDIGTTKLVLINYRNEFYLYRNSCPHRSIPLEWMPDQFLDFEKQYIQCATHGALFRIEDGVCVSGPCVEDHLDPVAFEIVEGQVIANLPISEVQIPAKQLT